MTNHTIKVSDFTRYPGPRYERLGPASGEKFRETVLLPALKTHGANLRINMDGVIAYGSSFLEEAFGGAIRAGANQNDLLAVIEHLICQDEESLKEEIEGYVRDQLEP